MSLVPLRRLGATTISLLALALGGCGAPAEIAVPAGDPVAIELGEFRLVPQQLRLAPGAHRFTVSNGGTMVHRLEVRAADGGRRIAHSPPLKPGASAQMVVRLPPGDYLIRCTQDRHNTLGEHGRIAVSVAG